MGMTGVDRESQFGAIQFQKERGQLGRATAGRNSRRHVLDADDHSRQSRDICQFRERFRQARASWGEIGLGGKSAGMNHQASASGFGDPIETSNEIANARASDRLVKIGEIHAIGFDRSTAPRTVRAPKDLTFGVEAFSNRNRIGKVAPIGENFDMRNTQPAGDLQVRIQVAARESISDHSSKRTNDWHRNRFPKCLKVFSILSQPRPEERAIPVYMRPGDDSIISREKVCGRSAARRENLFRPGICLNGGGTCTIAEWKDPRQKIGAGGNVLNALVSTCRIEWV